MKKNIIKPFLAVLLLLFVAENTNAQKNYTILIDTLNSCEMRKDILDIDYFEKNQENGYLDYDASDGSHIRISKTIEYENFSVRITPPLPKFYKIYKEYYLNGAIKWITYELGTVSIGKSTFFDKSGNITKIVDEDLKFGKYDYNKVILFLAKEGIVNLQTGKGRERLSVGYIAEEMMWHVTVNPTEDYSDMGCAYRISSKTGKVKKLRLVNNE